MHVQPRRHVISKDKPPAYTKKLEFVSKICKELLKLNNEKTTSAIGKWVKDQSRHPTKANIQIANKVWRNAQYHMSL